MGKVKWVLGVVKSTPWYWGKEGFPWGVWRGAGCLWIMWGVSGWKVVRVGKGWWFGGEFVAWGDFRG